MTTATISQHSRGVIGGDSTDLITPETTFTLRFAPSRANVYKNVESSESSSEEESAESEEDNESSTTSSESEESESAADEEEQEAKETADEADTLEQDTDDSDEEEEESSSASEAARVYKLSDFAVIKTVGTGSFGRVVLCRDAVTERYVAMKILAMADVIRMKQKDHVINERNVLAEISHPFMISCEWSTKDDLCLYMILEYVNGGELFSYIRNAVRLKNETAKFYAAEIVLALEYLHNLHIVYRDLKPENLLLTSKGHIKITDFGLSKKLYDRTWTLCGTPEYLAPEILQNKGYNKAVDWWALGILIFEMLIGAPPFQDKDTFTLYEKILHGEITWPIKINPVAKDLIKKLLSSDRTRRLGNMKNGASDVKHHRWFQHLNWNDVFHMKYAPPIVPKVTFDGDTSNFDDYADKNWQPPKLADPKDLYIFSDF